MNLLFTSAFGFYKNTEKRSKNKMQNRVLRMISVGMFESMCVHVKSFAFLNYLGEDVSSVFCKLV